MSLDGNFAPTARSRIFVRYYQTVGTQLDQLQNNLNGSRTSATGISIDPVTGVPIQVNNNFATGTQLPVYRTTTASATGVLNYDRDIFSVSASHDDQQLLSATAQSSTQFGAPVSTSGYQASAAWTHTVSPDLFSNATLQYTTRTVPFRAIGATGKSPDQTTLSLNLSLSYSFSQTLTGMLQYTRINTTGPSFGQPPRHDIATVSLQKTF